MPFIEYLKENLFLVEKKDHLIKRIKNLTDDQKNELIDFFNKNPHLETKIDWNNINTLTYDDFKPLFDIRTKTGTIKKVKQKGISGLIEGKDYVKFPISKGEAYIPLTFMASKLIAKKIGPCEGNWCTAADPEELRWRQILEKTLIYIILDDTKYAVEMLPNLKSIAIIGATNEYIDEIPGIDIRKEIKNNMDVINNARKIIQNRDSIYDKYKIKNYTENVDGTVDVDGDVDISMLFIKKIPLKFRKVNGNFYCHDNELETLEGAPEIVGGNFKCSNMYADFHILVGGPRIVGGNFDCSGNKLRSFRGLPKEIGGDLNCEGCLPSWIHKEEYPIKIAEVGCNVKGKIIA